MQADMDVVVYTKSDGNEAEFLIWLNTEKHRLCV
jgi:hypothetical protein